MPETTNKNFYIGICMAGAVSAGAYTAGVMDYLIEALEEWDKRKKANAPNTPQHNVVIPVLGGASAGGMTAIISAAALNNPITPVKEPLPDLMAERPENKFYHSWVDLLDKDMFPLMLDVDDMNEGIASLLNSSFIDKVADRAIGIDNDHWQPIPSFFSPDLKVFTTLTNLKGFGYYADFKASGNPEKYYMTVHNDFACFKLNDSGEEEDGWMYLDFKNENSTRVAKNAAMATGAFPVGLKSRELLRTSTHVNQMKWFKNITTHFPVTDDDCKTLNVDGGMINNEPFDKVRDVLIDMTGQQDEEQYQDEKKFKSTVLMIDPFPSKKPGKFEPATKLFHVMGLTFSAMMEQMRAKPAQLADALNEDCAGQYLIAPSRRRPTLDGKEEDVAGDKAIACGAFGGFAGFMNKEFRIHDFFLGRFNCEMFLRNYFTVSEEALKENPIFSEGYQGINREQFKGRNNGYQIIPIFTEAPSENYIPLPTFSSGSNWPVIGEEAIERFRPLMKKRVQMLLMNAVQLKGINKLLVWAGAKVVLNRVFTNAAMNTIKKALYSHQLLRLSEATLKEWNDNIKEASNSTSN